MMALMTLIYGTVVSVSALIILMSVMSMMALMAVFPQHLLFLDEKVFVFWVYALSVTDTLLQRGS